MAKIVLKDQKYQKAEDQLIGWRDFIPGVLNITTG